MESRRSAWHAAQGRTGRRAGRVFYPKGEPDHSQYLVSVTDRTLADALSPFGIPGNICTIQRRTRTRQCSGRIASWRLGRRKLSLTRKSTRLDLAEGLSVSSVALRSARAHQCLLKDLPRFVEEYRTPLTGSLKTLLGIHLADSSVWLSCVMSLAAFNISKAVEDGRVIEPVVNYSDGLIRCAFSSTVPLATLRSDS